MSNNSMENKILINDIVHGIIKLPSYICQIIDTAQFQRLRDIAQLGVSKFVYPSAAYSRFEHSIGTFCLASSLLEQLQNQTVNESLTVDITFEEKQCVEIAALCHDLGHGPFSHLWSHVFSHSTHIESSLIKSHEKLSVEIFNDLINNKVGDDGQSLKDKIGLNDEMINKIGRIILGDYDKNKDLKKRFLFEIVANKESGLDVDKFDYLCRDSIYFGWSNKNKIHDIRRVMFFMKIVKESSGEEWRLAIRDREIFHIFDIFYFRHLLHRYGYQHKTVKALECMLKEAVRDISNNPSNVMELVKNVFGNEIETSNAKEMMYSKEFISRCCESHIWDIMNKYTKDIVFNIRTRNLYKLFCKLQTDNQMKNEDVSSLEKLFKERIKDKSIFIFIAVSSFSLTSEKGNPILKIPFYKKEAPKECFLFDKSKNPPPSLLKFTNEEFNILVFTNKYIKKDSETDIIMKDIIQSLCPKGIEERHRRLKDLLNGIIMDNFEENENDDIKNDIKNVIKKIPSTVREDLDAIDCLRKRYKFRTLNY